MFQRAGGKAKAPVVDSAAVVGLDLFVLAFLLSLIQFQFNGP